VSERAVVESMITNPKTLPSDVTVGAVRAAFTNEHVHMVLLADAGVLHGTLLRHDLGDVRDDHPARPLAVLAGRTIHPSASADVALRALVESDARRLAVVDEHGRLLGLLCLKRRRTGFCSDDDLRARSDGALRG
jgi:CBS domain-containing protein